MTDQEFINNVWNKYDNYLKQNVEDTFFIKDQYKSIKFAHKLGLVFNFILSLIVTTGVVYASIFAYEFIQKNTNTNFDKNKGYDYKQNMIYNNSMYYKKIYNYNEYLEIQKIWDNLVELKQEEFSDYFIIIIAGENYATTNLYVSDIYDKDEKLFIELKQKSNEWNENNTVISVKVPKELDRENINLINLPNEIKNQNQKLSIDEISHDYSIEDAIQDNCFVVISDKRNIVVSEDKDRLNNFVNNCNNKINDYIRIYIKEPERFIIHDLEYKDNKIIMVTKEFNSGGDEMYYRTGNKLVTITIDSTIHYNLYDEIGNNTTFCILNF